MGITLTPAYGRDYRSKKEVEQAWHLNHDFIINSIGHRWDGKPINRTQAIESGYREVRVRYNNLRKVAYLEVK